MNKINFKNNILIKYPYELIFNFIRKTLNHPYIIIKKINNLYLKF